jgi:hypothetical protein
MIPGIFIPGSLIGLVHAVSVIIGFICDLDNRGSFGQPKLETANGLILVLKPDLMGAVSKPWIRFMGKAPAVSEGMPTRHLLSQRLHCLPN